MLKLLAYSLVTVCQILIQNRDVELHVYMIETHVCQSQNSVVQQGSEELDGAVDVGTDVGYIITTLWGTIEQSTPIQDIQYKPMMN